MNTVKAGVGVIVCRSDNKVLVGLRKGSHGEGVWAFPGGHIELTDASLKICGEREVMEETGVTCKVIKIDGCREDVFTTFDILSEDGSKRYLTSYLLAEYVCGETGVLEPHKCSEWRWVTLDEMKSLVDSETGRSWIPVDIVSHYLGQFFWLKKNNEIS